MQSKFRVNENLSDSFQWLLYGVMKKQKYILHNLGVEVADVDKASVLVVEIARAWVRTLWAAATKMDIGVTPPHKVAQWSKTGREWKTSKMIAEPRLYKNRKKKKKKNISYNS